ARHDRGPSFGRPDRGDERRPSGAGRHAARAADQPRRPVHRGAAVHPAAPGPTVGSPGGGHSRGRTTRMEELAERFRELPDFLGGHLLLSLSALGVGLAVSLPLGVLASRRPRFAELARGAAGVIQTVPSLALLALLVPLLGM